MVDGQRLRLEWHDLEGCTVGLAHLDGVLSSLLTMPWGSGCAVLCAVDPTGRVVGAGGLEFTDTARAYGAVAVLRGWRHRGLGAELAHRVSAAACGGGVHCMTCRCAGAVADAERTAALFDQVCVSRIKVGFQQLLLLRIAS